MTTPLNRGYGADRSFLIAGGLIGAAIGLSIAVSALWSARYGCIGMGIGLLALAGLRVSGVDYLRARSKRFDAAFIGGLGVIILILAVTADNL